MKTKRIRNLKNYRKFPHPKHHARLLMLVRHNFFICPTYQFFSGTPKTRDTKTNQERGLCWDEPPPFTYFVVSDLSSQVNPRTDGGLTALRRKTTHGECKSLCVPLCFLVRQDISYTTRRPIYYYYWLYHLSFRRTNGAAQNWEQWRPRAGLLLCAGAAQTTPTLLGKMCGVTASHPSCLHDCGEVRCMLSVYLFLCLCSLLHFWGELCAYILLVVPHLFVLY